MDELKEEQAAQLVSQLNKELFWTGWYACGNTATAGAPAGAHAYSRNIQWTTAENEKKSK